VVQVRGHGNRERKRMIYSYLAQYHKRLDNRQVDEIASARQTSSLFLKALLDELRIFGMFERINERISYYLQSETVGAFTSASWSALSKITPMRMAARPG